jgi:Putative holin
MLIGNAVGLLAGVAGTGLLHDRMRPELVMALVVGIPSVIGLTVIFFSVRRWATMLGASLLALAPGWLCALVVIQVASSG